MPTLYKYMDEERREIIRQRNSQYYHNNKEQINQRKKHYKFMDEEEREMIRQKNLKYYYDNKFEIKLRQQIYFREYYKKNRQKIINTRNGCKTIEPLLIPNEDEEMFKIIVSDISIDFN